MTEPTEFTVGAALPPPGHLSIEASAGTGKTYALSAVATRLLAEGEVAVDQLLVVTFTRAAAAELRDRIRRRVVGAARFLAAGAADPGDDDLHLVLASGGPAERSALAARLQTAVTDFDTATITTIHGFCTQVLATLGSTGDHNPDAVLVQDTRDLIAGACADLRSREAVAGGADPGVSLVGRVTAAVNNPSMRIEAVSGTPEDERVRDLVRAGVAAVRDRLGRTGSISFDGLLAAVRDAVAVDDVAARLADQFPVALIDEFQDTDPVQWEIFRSIYSGPGGDPRPGTRLVVVGDPKQAIYGFRGGDIHTYLDAVEGAEQQTLGTNWRSDGPVLHAMNALADGWTLGDDRIPYRPVRPAPDHLEGRLRDAGGRPLPALEIRCAVHPDLPRTTRGISADAARSNCVSDLAAGVRALLDDGATIDEVPVRPGDVAVLVHANAWAAPVQRALGRLGIPSVVAGGSSVAEAPAAEQWRILLDALARPADPRRARAAALSWFGGWGAAQVWDTVRTDGDDRALARIQVDLESWSATLRSRGVAALMSTVWAETELAARVLSAPGGERNLTDLDHLGELLHAATGGRPIGPESVRTLLDGLRTEDDDPEAIKRRIDTDASAVTIMTLHGSKGLEFPIVCLPSMWALNTQVKQRIFHDGDERVLDVSANARAKAVSGVHRLAGEELQGQNLRLAYVGLTRARHRTIVWWCPGSASAKSPIGRFLFGADESGKVAIPAPEDTVTTLRGRIGDLGVTACVEVADTRPPADLQRVAHEAEDAGRTAAVTEPPPAADTDAEAVELEVATLGREIDRSASRWSFTAATRRADQHTDDDDARGSGPAAPTGDPDDPSLGDAGDADEQVPPPPVLFEGLGAGAAFGTLVHEALEQVDFDADVEDELQTVVDVPWSAVPPDLRPRLVTAIAAAVHTPLGDAFGGARLADLGAGDRLDELDFELPLGRRERPDRPGTVAAVAARGIGTVLLDHLVDTDPVRPWAERLADGAIPVDLGGFLTGSIDLVMRLRGDDGEPRFSVVDYKTNRLGAWAEPDRVANYHPDLLPAAMAAHHYPLQAVLYSVALHRYLRWRLDGYRPEQHLGPVGYLFVRGMVGPDTPAPDGRSHGVFAWTVPPAAVTELSDLLDGGAP